MERMNSWPISMLAAGACSAAAILLIRELPRFAGTVPAGMIVGVYMIVGGLVVLAFGTLASSGDLSAIKMPSNAGMLGVAAIGILLAALEFFFVLGARQAMPPPDALIVYNVTSHSLVAIGGFVIFGEVMDWTLAVGVALGVGSMFMLLQPAAR